MKIELYVDAAGEWRWRLKARNGRILGDSAEGYKRKAACRKVAGRIAGGKIEVVDD